MIIKLFPATDGSRALRGTGSIFKPTVWAYLSIYYGIGMPF